MNIAIDDILTDPDDPIDLSTLSAADVTGRIQQLYSFLPSIESISITEDVATVLRARFGLIQDLEKHGSM